MIVRDEHGLGHESAGIVIKLAIGPGVTSFKEGIERLIVFADIRRSGCY